MTRNILVGFNQNTQDVYYEDCEVVSSALVVGGTYKGETIEEVETFTQPQPEKDVAYKEDVSNERLDYNCQMVTTAHYHEIVIID